MILHQFRKHLAYEIRNFPVKPNAATQSYALTTAVLARKILEYLDAKDLKDLPLPNGFKPESPSYKLWTVLNRIIHFRMFGQDIVSYAHPKKPDLVTLYSDRWPLPEDHLYIQLADYRNMMNRLATDDLFVAKYLLPRTTSLLSDALNAKRPQRYEELIERDDLQRSIPDFVTDTWDIICNLSDAGKVEILLFSIDCYEKFNGLKTKKYFRLSTCQEFFDGYLKIWQWAPFFNPHIAEIEGRETSCMLLNEIQPKESGTLRHLVISFDTLICFFTDVEKQFA